MATYGSPYMSSDPYQQQPQPFSPPAGGIPPGTITYTTSTGPDGKIVYNPFKAVPASYQTQNGVVSGIQWVPIEATNILPTGAQPANADFAAAWNRGYLSRDDERALKDWQKQEDKRRRKEEKEAAKRLEKRRDEEELRRARERDTINRERRKSFNAGSSPLMGSAYGTAAGLPGAYPSSPVANYASPNSAVGGYPPPSSANSTGGVYPPFDPQRNHTGGIGELDRKFGDFGIDNTAGFTRERKLSQNLNGDRPRGYSVNEPDRGRNASGGYGAGYRSTSPYPGVPPTNAYPSAAGQIPGAGPQSAPGGPYSANTYPGSPNIRSDSIYSAPGSAYAGSTYPPPSPNRVTEPIPRSASPYAGPAPYPPTTSTYVPPRSASPYAGPAPYPPTNSAYVPPRPVSPYAGPAPYPPGSAGTAYGQPGPPLSRSRATTPIPGAGGVNAMAFPSNASYPQPGIRSASPMPSPRVPNTSLGGNFSLPETQLAAPEGFSRPRNRALSYTPFETMKIQDMDEFEQHIPRMPLVLEPHDVYHEDWIRFMSDLALAWSGRLPVPELAVGGRPPKRSTLAGDLIDLWNGNFFVTRGVEVVLYKGRERRSGPNAGLVDRSLPGYYDDESDSEDSSDVSSDDDSDSTDNDRRGYGLYGRPAANQSTEAYRRRREKKAEKKRRRKEKKQRKKAKERERRYALYLICVAQSGYASGQGPAVGPGYGGGY